MRLRNLIRVFQMEPALSADLPDLPTNQWLAEIGLYGVQGVGVIFRWHPIMKLLYFFIFLFIIHATRSIIVRPGSDSNSEKLKTWHGIIIEPHNCWEGYEKNWMHFVYKLDHRGFQTRSLIQRLTSLIGRLTSTWKKHTIRVLLADWWMRYCKDILFF